MWGVITGIRAGGPVDTLRPPLAELDSELSIYHVGDHSRTITRFQRVATWAYFIAQFSETYIPAVGELCVLQRS